MTIRCLITGCNWSAGEIALMGKETVLCQCCGRCGSFRYLPEH
ncbi:PSPA7_2676 family Cys-rich small protein [Pseudomonas paralcaligenes]|nr:PSPA7_2676 family Cys-rich small protein [Pseudomonas paralcaligenes]